MEKKLVIIDSNSLLNRAFYAISFDLKSKDGIHVNAILGYLRMLSKIIKDIKPTHLAATFDAGKTTFRNELYPEYKATRKPMSDELAMQLPIIKDILKSMKIEPLEVNGFEADDLMGTLANKFDGKVVIVTGDRDLLQTVNDKTTVLLTVKGVSVTTEYTPIKVKEENLTNIVDIKSLMGDSSDNIPGVHGIGKVTAMNLINKYKTLEKIYENIDSLSNSVKTTLLLNKDMAFLSKKLATINVNVPIDYIEDNFLLDYPFKNKVKENLFALNMHSLINQFQYYDDEPLSGQEKITHSHTKLDNLEQLRKILEKETKLKGNIKFVSLILGNEIKICIDSLKEYIYYIPEGFFAFVDNVIDVKDIIEIINEIDATLIVFDYKNILYSLKNDSIKIKNPIFDLSVAAYLVDSNNNFNKISELLSFYNCDKEYESCGLFEAYYILKEKLKELDLEKLYYEIDLPLIQPLFDMETAGVNVDIAKLEELSKKYHIEINALSNDIYKLAGEQFNISSSPQVNNILYKKLNLPSNNKKIETYSADADTLMELYYLHPIVPLILRYRKVAKLLSTYLDGLKNVICSDGKIHTIFTNSVTTTGRLSSIKPNMQNIPTKDSEGHEIKHMFIASENSLLISADYSQIELRLMASFSGDKNLLTAFCEGHDVHAETAMRIFNVNILDVTPEMRRIAKTVNFGIIYGISDYGLSSELSISVKRAKEFIEKYFIIYPDVKNYMNDMIEFAKVNGYVRTYFNRIRFLPNIKSKAYTIRTFSERAAINMPLQGTAADIMKIAIIKVDSRFKKENLKSKLILTVHDELVIDAPLKEKDIVENILKTEMENIGNFKVPLKVNISSNTYWEH